MFIPFESLPGNARLWIYQSNRKFTSLEADIISQELLSFTQQWEVHGQPMKASFKLYHDQFVILAADEAYNEASGCSIDGSVRTLKRLGSHLNLEFFDRSTVAFMMGQDVVLIALSKLKQELATGKWNGQSLVFNNTVATKAELDQQWLVQTSETWLKRYLTDAVLKPS